MVFGGLVAGPLLSRWYGVLNRKVVLANSFAGLCARVALDQLVFTPVFISVFFTGMGLMEGKNLGELREKLAETFQGTLVANWKLWIPFQFVNFYVTPPVSSRWAVSLGACCDNPFSFQAYRLLAVNMTATGWNTFLAYTNERANRKLARQSNEPVKR